MWLMEGKGDLTAKIRGQEPEDNHSQYGPGREKHPSNTWKLAAIGSLFTYISSAM